MNNTVPRPACRPLAPAGLLAACLFAAVLTACGGEPSDLGRIQRTLGEMRDDLSQLQAGDAVDLAREDLESFGDWQYRVVTLEAQANEDIEAALNTLGEERWEVFWVRPAGDGLQVLLKRPARSYLRALPLSEIGRYLFDGSGN